MNWFFELKCPANGYVSAIQIVYLKYVKIYDNYQLLAVVLLSN